jgi:hypothetical protein
VAAVAYAWAEWTTEARYVLPGGRATFGDDPADRRFWINDRHQRGRALKTHFLPAPGTRLLVLSWQRDERVDLWVVTPDQVVASVRSGAQPPRFLLCRPEWVSPWWGRPGPDPEAAR